MQKHCANIIFESPQNNNKKKCFFMIKYNRLRYEIKRNFYNFLRKNFKRGCEHS